MRSLDFNKYNSPNSLLVITSFPNPVGNKYGKRNFNAVGWHSERTLFELSKKRKVLVCAEKSGDKKAFELGKTLYVNRVWEKTNPFSLISLFFFIARMNYISSIFVQFEFNVFGGTLMNILLMGLLLILRLMGKRIAFELHQVILDVKPLENHVNIKNILMQKFLGIGLRLFYRFLGYIANTVIVFEQELKTSLLPYMPSHKIEVLSLPVEQRETIPVKKAKRKLKLPINDFTVLLFGYINGYKGIDFAIDSFKNSRYKHIRLVVAGGKNPYLKNKLYYQKYYSRTVNAIHSKKNISYFDFIPDRKVELIFSAADLVILPYKVFMSASGPFSLALSYKKPVIISKALEKYAESFDFQEAMEESRLVKKDLVFALEQRKFLHVLGTIKNKRTLYRKLKYFSSQLAKKRNFELITDKYDHILFASKKHYANSPIYKLSYQ